MRESFEVYICTQCDYFTSAEPKGAIGTIHAHAEKHANPRPLGLIKLPSWFPWPVADPKELDKYVRKLEVTHWNEKPSLKQENGMADNYGT